MKKTFSILMMLMIVSSVVFARRLDNPGSSMAVLKSGSTFKLLYKGASNTDVKILILNDDNEIVFSEKIKNEGGFLRPYNFTELPEGDYHFQLTDINGRQTEKVNYRKGSNSKVAHLLRVGGNNEKFILSVPNKGTDILTVTIYDAENTVLYTEREKVTGDFGKVYTFKGLQGNVTFNVTDSHGKTQSLSKERW